MAERNLGKSGSCSSAPTRTEAIKRIAPIRTMRIGALFWRSSMDSLLLGLLSGFIDALARGAIKLSRSPPLVLNGFGMLIAASLEGIWLYTTGVPVVSTAFWVVLGAAIPLAFTASMLTIAAHRVSPMILTTPYLAITPVILLVTGPMLGTGTPTLAGGAGVVLVAIGIYVLNGGGAKGGLLEPFRVIAREQGSWLMILVGLIYGINANWTKLGPLYANAPFFLVVFHSAVGVISLTIARVRTPGQGMVVMPDRSQWAVLLCYGGLIAAGEIALVLAMTDTATVYAIAAKRFGTVLFSITLGIFLARLAFFKERFSEEKVDLAYRLPAALFIVVGMILITILGNTRS